MKLCSENTFWRSNKIFERPEVTKPNLYGNSIFKICDFRDIADMAFVDYQEQKLKRDFWEFPGFDHPSRANLWTFRFISHIWKHQMSHCSFPTVLRASWYLRLASFICGIYQPCHRNASRKLAYRPPLFHAMFWLLPIEFKVLRDLIGPAKPIA